MERRKLARRIRISRPHPPPPSPTTKPESVSSESPPPDKPSTPSHSLSHAPSSSPTPSDPFPGIGGNWLIARCVYHNDGYGTFLAGQRINSAELSSYQNPVMLNDWVYGQLQVVAQQRRIHGRRTGLNNGGVLKARRIAANLQPLAPSFNLPPVTTGIWGDGVATSGNELYVTWLSNFTDLVGSRMTNTGVLLNPAGTLLFPNFSGHLDITHDGTNWWLSRTISNSAYLLRVYSNDALLDPVGGVPLPISVSGTVNSLYDNRLAPRAGGGVMYAWTDLRQANGNDQNAFVIPVSPSNVPDTEQAVPPALETNAKARCHRPQWQPRPRLHERTRQRRPRQRPPLQLPGNPTRC